MTAYLIVTDARRAVDWYVEVLGARRRGDALVMPDGRVGHVEIDIGANALFLADESPESPVAAPVPGAPATVSLVVETPAVDAMVQRAAGRRRQRRARRGRARLRPQRRGPGPLRPSLDHLVAPVEPVADAAPGAPWPPPGRSRPRGSAPMQPGDIGYVSLWVPDVARAQAFFGAVLGWSFGPGSSARGRQVEGASPQQGLWGEMERSTLFVCYCVDAVDAALVRVRDAGGRAEDPTDEPFGRVATCTDDQGTAFAVFHPSGR